MTVFAEDNDLLRLRSPITQPFLNAFNDGINAYINGDWHNAKILLLQANQIMKEHMSRYNIDKGDGPSESILNYIGSFGYVAPACWKGFRVLNSK